MDTSTHFSINISFSFIKIIFIPFLLSCSNAVEEKFVNTAPITVEDFVFCAEDRSISFRNPMLNDYDPDGDGLVLKELKKPGHGIVTEDGNGDYTYWPEENYHGPDSLEYVIRDEHGATTKGIVEISVREENDAPVAMPDSISVSRNKSKTINVLENDYDVDEGDQIEIRDIINGEKGSAVIPLCQPSCRLIFLN